MGFDAIDVSIFETEMNETKRLCSLGATSQRTGLPYGELQRTIAAAGIQPALMLDNRAYFDREQVERIIPASIQPSGQDADIAAGVRS